METLKKLFDNYVKTSKSRGYSFDLTLENFEKLVNDKCFYCDFKKDNKRNGIDRVDNTRGYEDDNCVSCCWKCNWMKSNLSPKEFIDWLERIIKEHPKWSKIYE